MVWGYVYFLPWAQRISLKLEYMVTLTNYYNRLKSDTT